MKNSKYKRRLQLVAIDILIMAAVFLFTALLTFFVGNETLGATLFLQNFFVFALAITVARIVMRVYLNVWRYANSKAYLDIISSDIIGGFAALMFTYATKLAYVGAWRSVAFVAMTDCMTLVSRFVYQQKYRHWFLNEIQKGGINNKIGVASQEVTPFFIFTSN